MKALTPDVVVTKAELLCFGIRPNQTSQSIYSRQNPEGNWKTGNVGIHLRLPGDTHVLVTLGHPFDTRSPFTLEKDHGANCLMKSGEFVCEVFPVEAPRWYAKVTSTGMPMGSVFLHECKRFLHQAYSGCDYHAFNMACKYCSAGATWNIGSPIDVCETVEAAILERPSYHVCLGGGTRLPHQRNVEYFAACARAIRKHLPSVPIWVEMAPPETPAALELLVDCGVTSFGFNIELWSDSRRQAICPGKSQIPKSRYITRMREATKALGSNRVGSCLLVGLESEDSTRMGVAALTEIGVQPCLLPFKPWANSNLCDLSPCQPELFLDVSHLAADCMRASGLDPNLNQGCLMCDGCTIDHDILRLMSQGEQTEESPT